MAIKVKGGKAQPSWKGLRVFGEVCVCISAIAFGAWVCNKKLSWKVETQHNWPLLSPATLLLAIATSMEPHYQ